MWQPRRAGFSLIELLIVIAIVAVLLGLLLPAVQRIREAASRHQCLHNLKQLALACHNYHDAQNTLPPGVDMKLPNVFWSWMAKILPYLEQEPLFKQADAWVRTDDNWVYGRSPVYWWPWGSEKVVPNPAFAVPVPGFICSSESRSMVGTHSTKIISATITYGFSSYLGVSGVRGDFSGPVGRRVADAMNGTLFTSSKDWTASSTLATPPIRLLEITDGTSNTLLIGERPPYQKDSPGALGIWFADQGYDGSGTGGVVLGAREVNFAAKWGDGCPSTKVGFQPGDVNDPCDVVHFWSLHRGGANFAFADGSVRFLAYNPAMAGPDNKLFQALATRAGGESIPDY